MLQSGHTRSRRGGYDRGGAVRSHVRLWRRVAGKGAVIRQYSHAIRQLRRDRNKICNNFISDLFGPYYENTVSKSRKFAIELQLVV